MLQVEEMQQKHWLEKIPIGIDSSMMMRRMSTVTIVVSSSVSKTKKERLNHSFAKLHVLALQKQHDIPDGMVVHFLGLIRPGRHHRGCYWVPTTFFSVHGLQSKLCELTKNSKMQFFVVVLSGSP